MNNVIEQKQTLAIIIHHFSKTLIILRLHSEECLLLLLHSHDSFLHSNWETKIFSISDLKLQFSLVKYTSLTGTLHRY